MANGFHRTLRSFEADSFRLGASVLVAAMVVLAAWLTWCFFSRVAVVEIASSGRVESISAVHQVDSSVAGEVVRVAHQLGDEVQPNDLLIELDARPQQIELEKTRAEQASRTSELTLLRGQIASEEKAQGIADTAERAALHEAEARREELLPKLELTEQKRRLAGTAPSGSISPLEVLERKSEDESAHRAADVQGRALSRLSAEQALAREKRDLHLQELRRDSVRLEGELPVLAATIARLQDEISRHQIRSPAKGRLGQVAMLTPGAFVKVGDRLAVVVSEGDLHVHAEFPAETAVGVIQEGQRARLRFPGYPWPIYGTIDGTVRSVGTEPLSGNVAVDLSLKADPKSFIVLQHGLPAEVEVEVRKVSPAQLVLRAIGQATPPAKKAGAAL
ncbi:MAG TPA: HlyD family efflux transporter periplasmic adaptor subunit [Myxococcales bacterium]